jgi:hypothetical protein
MDRSYILFLIILLLPLSAFSQVKLTGRLLTDLNDPIPFAEVALMANDTTTIANALTKQNGDFILHTNTGSYLLRIRILGNVLYANSIHLTEDRNMGIIKIEKKLSQLKEVTVEGRKKLIERKVDRLIFNVENSTYSSGGDAIDVLKVMPGLRVQNDVISMIGKSDVAVMIDDRVIRLSKDDLMNFLKTIRSNDIKTIEVITNPPAKYDAEGNSGLVNIRLKKAKRNTWNGYLNGVYTQTTYPGTGIGSGFNYQKDKLSLFTSLSYNNGSKKGTENEKIQYVDQLWDNNFTKRIYSDIFSGRVGLDYKLKKNWSVGLQYLGSFNKPHTEQTDHTIITSDPVKAIDSMINTRSNDKKNNNASSVNLHSIYRIDSSGKTISFDLDYFTYNNDINRDFQTHTLYKDLLPTPYGYSAATNSGVQNVDNYAAKVDVDYPLNWIKMSFGAKISHSKTNYDIKYYNTTSGTPILQPKQSNAFEYSENIQALYFSGSKKVSAKWELQLGLRTENTQSKGNSITLNKITENYYIKFFPTAYILYHLNADNDISIDYGRRLQRPRYNELNPFRVYYNPYSYTQGNPFLIPQIADNFGLKYSYKDMLITSLSFTRITNGLGNVPIFNDTTKVLYLLDLNYYTIDKYDISQSFVFNKFSWLESENQIDLYYMKSKLTENVDLKPMKGWGYYFSSNNSLVLNRSKTVKANINFWYQSPQYDQLYKYKAMAGLDLAIRFSIPPGNTQVSLIAQDILRTNKSNGTAHASNVQYMYADYYDQRLFRLSISYLFGDKKINVKKRAFGNEEEKRRVDN